MRKVPTCRTRVNHLHDWTLGSQKGSDQGGYSSLSLTTEIQRLMLCFQLKLTDAEIREM